MKDNKDIILTYLGDMSATEAGIRDAAKRHLEDDNTKDHANARALFSKVASAADAHHKRLEEAIASRGGSASHTVKKTATSVIGVAHGVFDKLREHTVSKMLRDTHTELNLAAIAQLMLHTTGLGLGDAEVAQIALSQLESYTPLIMEIGHLTPELVLRDLKDDDYAVNMDVLGQAQSNYGKAWRSAEGSHAS